MHGETVEFTSGSSLSLTFEHATKLLLRFLNLNFYVYMLIISLIGRAVRKDYSQAGCCLLRHKKYILFCRY